MKLTPILDIAMARDYYPTQFQIVEYNEETIWLVEDAINLEHKL